MPRITLLFGLGFIVLGIVGYVGSDTSSVTALIPSFFGVVFAVLGFLGENPERRALTMHIAAGVAVLGLLGSAMGLMDLPALLSGDDLDRPWAVGTQSVMAVGLVVYLILAVRSFMAARRTRTA